MEPSAKRQKQTAKRSSEYVRSVVYHQDRIGGIRVTSKSQMVTAKKFKKGSVVAWAWGTLRNSTTPINLLQREVNEGRLEIFDIQTPEYLGVLAFNHNVLPGKALHRANCELVIDDTWLWQECHLIKDLRTKLNQGAVVGCIFKFSRPEDEDDENWRVVAVVAKEDIEKNEIIYV